MFKHTFLVFFLLSYNRSKQLEKEEMSVKENIYDQLNLELDPTINIQLFRY